MDYAIIGGGVIGQALALALGRRKNAEVVVIEACQRDRIENQSTRNSGVVHASIYYKKAVRPLKARLCAEGNALLYEFCQDHGVHHARTGKLVVATNALEEAYLADVFATAIDNQIPGVTMISGAQAAQMEPNVLATKALHAPSSGVIDVHGYLKKLRAISQSHQLFGTRVVSIQKVHRGFQVQTTTAQDKEVFLAKTVVNAAGLHADEVARMINAESPHTILPVRGEAAKFYDTRRPELAMRGLNVYPVPHGFYKKTGLRAEVPWQEFQRLLAAGEIIDTLGVHLTPTLDEQGHIAKTVTIGPCNRAVASREDFARQLHPPSYYWERVKSFFPGLRIQDIELHQTGIQARLLNSLDWVIERDAVHSRFINLIGIDSPGLTASLAIAQYVVDSLID